MNTQTLSTNSNQKFSDVRRRASMQAIVKLFTGRPVNLLPFEEIRSHLRLNHTRYLGIQDVPLDKIVGSVGRYDDFTREFLPLRDDQEERWRRIYDLASSMQGFPPVVLYKVGDAYFVRDGNHRVSVARANGAPSIEASVAEYLTPVKISATDTLDDILIKAGVANFLQVTRLDALRPEQNIILTNPGRYKRLLADIERHRYFREIECQCEISDEEAVVSWFDTVYLPLINEIRARDILRFFPDRTEADLYAWLVLHRESLEAVYGIGRVDTDEVIDELEEEATATGLQKLERAIKRKLNPNSLPPAVE